MTLEGMQKQIRQLGELVIEMERILDDASDDTPLAFFEACEEAQHQVTQLMRSAFIAVQRKPE
ncbi:MAG: hypothetical protein CMK71_11930 [Pseudomonadaceae bacterium]|nr:hypothetical protein [Pseudomonadaceae bacterium]